MKIVAKMLFTVAFLAASTLVMIASTSLPAFADACIPPTPTCIGVIVGSNGEGVGNDPAIPDDPGTPDPDSDPSSGGGSGGSGGTDSGADWSMSGQGFFPRQPPARIGGRGPGDPGWTTTSNVYRYGNACGGNFSWSAGGRNYRAPYIGWRWYLSGAWQLPFLAPSDAGDDPDLPAEKRAESGSYECIEPPRYYDFSVKCAAYGTARMLGPVFNSSTVGAPTRNLPRQYSRFERGGRQDPSLCGDSYTFNFGRSPTAWGQYELIGYAYVRDCTVRRYYTADERTGTVPPAEVVGCSGVRREDVDRARVELFCEAPYVHRAWHNYHTFTTADCMGGNSTWSCGPQINEDPTFNGQSLGRNRETFGVLDDGKTRRAAWSTIQPTGDLRRISRRQAMLRFIEGSPFREGAAKNGDTQPFFITPKNDAGMKNGWRQAATASNKTAWDMAFLAPGVADHPFTVRPRWAFRAQFLSYVPDFTWDLGTNTLTYELVPVWIAADATCDGQPLRVDVSRARNTNN